MAKAKRIQKEAGVSQYKILLRPIITEKSSLINGGVVFEVARCATKPEIKTAVERVFNVEVAKVRTCSYRGKKKRIASAVGHRASYKKAYVTLKEGHTIDIVEGL